MSPLRKLFCPIFAVLLVPLLALACGGGSSKTVDVPGGGQIGVSQDLPGDFPGDFPIYKGAKLQGSAQGEENGIQGTVVTWDSGDSFEDVKKFYEDEFKSGSWKADASGTVQDSAYWSVSNSSRDKSAYVSVTKGDKTVIVAVIGPASAGIVDTPAAGDTPEPSGTSEPSSQLPSEEKLPSDFPSDSVPLPSNIRVTSGASVSAGGSKIISIEFYTKQSADDLAKFFADNLPPKGWTQSVQSSSGGEIFASYAKGGDASGATIVITISKSPAEGYTLVTLQISNA